MLENFSAMRNSDDSKKSSDSLGENRSLQSLKQVNYKVKQQKTQSKSREILDKQDHQKADEDLKIQIERI